MIQILLIVFLFTACQKIHVRPSDTIAIVFCGSQKSLTTGMFLTKIQSNILFNFYIGMPILQMIFPNNVSITIPLLIYHPMQIIIGNYLTPRFQVWLKDVKHTWLVS